MRFLDALLGRRRTRANQLDALFGIPNAAITLETAAGFRPTGKGAVCFRAAEGAAAAQTQSDIVALLDSDTDGPDVTLEIDSFGFTWLVTEQQDMSELCSDLHAVNSTLEAQGFGPGLLCSLVAFEDAAGRRVALVYLYRQGTFYPFVPLPDSGSHTRDNLLEIQIRDHLSGELPMEPDLSRWMALWGAPGV
jgi:hypothetical protein